MSLQSRQSFNKQTHIIDRLAKKYGKYALVVGVAKRAHDLTERVGSHLLTNGTPVTSALREIARGEVRIRESSEE